MSYFKTYGSVCYNDSSLINEILSRDLVVSPYELKCGRELLEDNNGWLTEKRIRALKSIGLRCIKLFLGYFVMNFVDTRLSEIAMASMKRNKHNQKLFDYFHTSIANFYKENPTYKPLTIQQYKKSRFYETALARVREKDLKEILSSFKGEFIYGVLSGLIGTLCPMFLSQILVIPAFMMCTYLGFDVGMGSLYNMAIQLDNGLIQIGLSYTKEGIKVANVYLFSVHNGKIVRHEIPDPPRDSYRLSHTQTKEIFSRYTMDGINDNLEQDAKRMMFV